MFKLHIFTLASLFLVFSCGTKRKNKAMAEHEITGVIQIHQPYCGGARPTEEMMQGTNSPVSETTFYIKKGTTHNRSESVYKTVKTKEDGTFSIRLPQGEYVMLSEQKLLSFEEYKKATEIRSTYMEYLGDDCSRLNHESADFLLKVSKDSSVVFTYKSRCQVGTNPCYRYIGPKPQ
jgi:hypothetical protein